MPIVHSIVQGAVAAAIPNVRISTMLQENSRTLLFPALDRLYFITKKGNGQLKEFKVNIPQFSSASDLSMEVAFFLA